MTPSSFPAIQRGSAQRGGTAPLNSSVWRAHPERVWSERGARAAGNVATPCVVELAPGHGYPVSALGLDISRDFLLRFLPAGLVATDRVRATLNLLPQIDGVAPADECHCALRWHYGWRLVAHRPVVCGRAIYDNCAQLDLPRSTALLLGVGGWPIIIRINETHIPL